MKNNDTELFVDIINIDDEKIYALAERLHNLLHSCKVIDLSDICQNPQQIIIRVSGSENTEGQKNID